MIPVLRPYQAALDFQIDAAWAAGCKNVLAELPTGAGKTVTFSKKLRDHNGAGVAIAHRQELVGQISLSLSHFAIRHRIIGPPKVIKIILEKQRDELGRTYYDPNAPIAVAGVDTLIRRVDSLQRWINQVTLWIQDEAHHVLRANKWGTATTMFPHARGLGVTATPGRADGKGLGRDADGVFDKLVSGPGMRDLINAGYLSDYEIYCPPSDLDLSEVHVDASGEGNKDDVKKAVGKSRIVGDVVAHYLRIAPGKLGITFASDVETAQKIADQYNAAGVPAAMICSLTSDDERERLIKMFKARQLLQLVNVDLFGEGFDVPGIEVVSMARPTWSYNVYAQQFGRALRTLIGKLFGIIIDHVGNVFRHGLPDKPRRWTLDAREKSGRKERDPNLIPLTSCTAPGCFRAYEAILNSCPYCGSVPEPAGRSRPEQVHGDLYKLDPAVLAAMRGEVDRIDGPVMVPMGMTGAAAGGLVKSWRERKEAQVSLRNSIALWAGYRRAEGHDDSQIYKLFYWKFGTTVIEAQALGRGEAENLTAKLEDSIYAQAI